MELRDDSFLDGPILHQLDFILHVTGVSFSFDNIFLSEVENESFCTNIANPIGLYLFWLPFSSSRSIVQ